MRTAIVTDTNSGMSVEEGKRRGIFVIQMPVIIDGVTYHEGRDISYEAVFRALADHRDVTTSQPVPADLLAMWDRILGEAGYDELVYIPMSSGLSSSCETAKGLAEADYEGRVCVADNKRISLTLYESILDAREMAERGMSAREICARLEEKLADATIYLTVESLEHLRKSGRITAAVAKIATVLNIRPIMTIQGERLDAFARVRGRAAAERRMIAATLRDLKERIAGIPANQVLIGAAGTLLDKLDIERWSSKIREAFPGYTFLYHPLPCSIACHVGPNAFGTGYVVMDRTSVEEPE